MISRPIYECAFDVTLTKHSFRIKGGICTKFAQI